MSAMVLLVTFGAGFFLVFGINLLYGDIISDRRQERRVKQSENRRLQELEQKRQSTRFNESYTVVASNVGADSEKENPKQRLEKLVLQSGLDISMNGVVGASMIAGVIPAILIGFLLHNMPMGVAAFAPCSLFPLAYVLMSKKRRNKKILSQLPDAFELMGRMLRSGQTMAQALQGVADECPAPLGPEFLHCYEQQNLGLSVEKTMQELAHRTGLLEIKVFVVAITIHRQTGGNLSQLLETLSGVMRERGKIDGKIGALTAEGRMQAWILLALPLLLLGALFFINRPYMMTLLDYPALIGGMFACEFLGAVWIRKIINFDF